MNVKHTVGGTVTALLGIALSVGTTVVGNPSCVPSELQGYLPILGALLSIVGVGVAAKGPSVISRVAR